MKYVIFFMVLMITGCGSQPDFKPQPPLVKNNSNIDINNSLTLIKRELADKYLSSYPAKEEQTLFVLITDDPAKYEQTYSLLQYDITKTPPVITKYIVDHSDKKISFIYPLSNHKLIYLSGNKFYYYQEIVIFDYKLLLLLRKYRISNIYQENKQTQLTLSKDQNYFQYGIVKVDISDIYNNGPIQQKSYRDDRNNIVIDPVHHLIWQDDTEIFQKEYSYNEALLYCQNKPGFNWRLPALKDISLLLKQQSELFLTSPFNYTKSNEEFGYITYWVKSDGLDSEKTWTYDPKQKLFDFDTHYSAYIRCVSDLK